jgi:hypothetical protein
MEYFSACHQAYSALLRIAEAIMWLWRSQRIFGVVFNVLQHPRLSGAIQLIVLGLIAESSRRLAMLSFITLRKTFCITSTHHLTDESYDWLMSERASEIRLSG